MSRYFAFISYRHQPLDTDAALRLRRGLEGYHLPSGCPIPKKRTVFRDTDELPTSTDLGADIEHALQESDWLIALCSEEYIGSRWCRREIELYLALGRKDRILPVLLSGSPETSVPEEIRDLPLAADLRPYRRGKMQEVLPELLARMSGMPADRFAAAQQRFLAGAAFTAVCCAALTLLGFGVYASRTALQIAANNERIAAATLEAEQAEREAVEERNTALLRQAEYISQQAWGALAQEDTDRAIELALSALPEDLHGDLPVSAEASAVLRTALSMETSPSYHLFRSVETGFEIDGYYIYGNLGDRVFLTEDHIRTSEHYIDYRGETGDLASDMADLRQEAIGLGYTDLYYLAGDVNAKRLIFCGPDLPLYGVGYQGYYRTDYTWQGEPFPADAMACGDGNIVAWQSDPSGSGPRTLLFRINTAEAVARLDLAAPPSCVSFSYNGSYILVVDRAGELSVFDRSGALCQHFPGTYTCALYFYCSGDYAYAGCEDGTVVCFDLERMEEAFRFSCPAAVREIRANRDRRCLLVRSDAGVFLHHLNTGTLLSEVGDHRLPKHVLFQDDLWNEGSDARMILMIYDRRVELYGLDTEIDDRITDYRPLISEGVPAGKDLWYSRDGKRIFQHSQSGYNAASEDVIYCWDAADGTLLWQYGNPRQNYNSQISRSRDGKTCWRVYEEGQLGIERFDEVTGEVLLSAQWPGQCWQPAAESVTESPDGKRGFLINQMSSTSTLNCSQVLFAFDTETGSELWRMELEKREADWRKAHGEEYEITWAAPAEGVDTVMPQERRGFAKAMFSEDGEDIYLIQKVEKKGGGASGYAVDRIRTDTGTILEEKFLETEDCGIFLWEEEHAIVLIDKQPEEVNQADRSVMKAGVWYYPTYTGAYEEVTVTHTVRIYDPERGIFTARTPFSYRRSPEAYNRVLTVCRSCDGGLALYWEARNEDDDGQDYCCRLYPDGSFGPVREADTEEGRRLWVAPEDYLIFQGEDAFINDSRLCRLSDGSPILAGVWTSTLHVVQTGSSVLFREGSSADRALDVAKDGSSICIFSRYGGNNRYPFLIYPSDLDTLVEKGRRRMGLR